MSPTSKARPDIAVRLIGAPSLVVSAVSQSPVLRGHIVAHFRAVIQGNRGEASRLGTKRSGVYARLQTWGHDLILSMRHRENGDDWVSIEIVRHDGAGFAEEVLDVNLTTGKAYARKATVAA
jgi:hypothetical protein